MKFPLKLLKAKILNPYKSKKPTGFYGVRGHTGVDLYYVNESLPSPITGTVLATTKQVEMGNCMYIEDINQNVHVFAHLDKFKKQAGDKVQRNEIIAITGNTGTKTTNPHLHYEIITTKPINLGDLIMKRKLLQFSGWNTEPILYIKNLYKKYNIDNNGISLTK